MRIAGSEEDDGDNSKIEIIQTIFVIAENMNIEVVAEGVELKSN
jgi:EAL domain-containing protein (putative c-di-GMP-specific phosphodiesterase class I)